jgi:hypothetical protein
MRFREKDLDFFVHFHEHKWDLYLHRKCNNNCKNLEIGFNPKFQLTRKEKEHM